MSTTTNPTGSTAPSVLVHVDGTRYTIAEALIAEAHRELIDDIRWAYGCDELLGWDLAARFAYCYVQGRRHARPKCATCGHTIYRTAPGNLFNLPAVWLHHEMGHELARHNIAPHPAVPETRKAVPA